MAVLIAQNFKNDPQRGNFFSLHKYELLLAFSGSSDGNHLQILFQFWHKLHQKLWGILDKLQSKYFTQTVMFILFFYRKEGDNEFMNIIANEINTEVRLLADCFTLAWYTFSLNTRFICRQETLVFLTVGEEKGPGLFLLAGPSGPVSELGPR